MSFEDQRSLFGSKLKFKEALLSMRGIKATEKLFVIELGILKFKIKHLCDVSDANLHGSLS